MKITNEIYKGMEAYALENDNIKVTILKSFGGKVASIYYKKQSFEVLFQPTKNKYSVPAYDDNFEDYDTSGWDEAYPTIDKCKYPYDTELKGLEMPDHGELWSIPWEYAVEGDTLKATVTSPKFKYIFTRTITLKDNSIRAEYEVKNLGNDVFHGIWAFHCLLACDEHTRLKLKNVDEVMNVHDSALLGKVGKVHTYPVTKTLSGGSYNLDKINPVSVNKTEKFYVNGELKKGEAGITLNKGKLLLTLNFPEEKIPYLGVWIDEGGFKGEYNCALEPTNGFYDSVELAKKYNKLEGIMPNENKVWFLDITLKEI